MKTSSFAALFAWVREIGGYVGNTLEKVRQQRAMQRLTQAERLQRALFAISDMAGSDMDMPMLLRGLHEIVGTLMYAENFLIALYDEKEDGIRIIYFVDTAEEEWSGIGATEPMDSIKYSLTWYILREGRPLMGPTAHMQAKVSGPLRRNYFTWKSNLAGMGCFSIPGPSTATSRASLPPLSKYMTRNG